MEFGRVSDDHYAGYVVDDSDLEYSDCSEGDRYANYAGQLGHAEQNDLYQE